MRTVAAGVVLLVAAVTGCSSGDAPPADVAPLASGTASATTTSSATEVSATPSVTGTTDEGSGEVPTAPHPPTVDGASAFARDYVRLIGRGFVEANPSALRSRTAPGCEGCESLISAMDRAAADGLRRRGGDYTVTSVAVPPFEGGDVVLLMTYTRSASEIVDADGVVVDRAPEVSETTVQMRLVYGERGWLTQGYRVV